MKLHDALMRQGYHIKSRVWIEGERGTFLAEGRIRLLEHIITKGSISQAAKEMKMSYRKAWEIIDGMNKEGNEPLVTRISGGKNGGGTIVTDYGKKMIEFYNEVNKNCQEYLRGQINSLYEV